MIRGLPAVILSGALLLQSLVVAPMARAEIFDVDVSSSALTLATDSLGQEIKFGGFSGLYPVPRDRTKTLFYTITDRGPSGDFTSSTAKVYPSPGYSPSILKIQLRPGGTAQILEIIPLKKPDGSPITGLPNTCLPNQETAFDLNQQPLAGDPDGLDVEGLTMDRSGNFWICEEYRPSICLVTRDGTVRMRLVPQGSVCGSEQIPTFDILPAALSKRRLNRGFEGIALAGNHRLYAIMQRPLNNPNQTVGNASRNVRLVEIDLHAVLSGCHLDQAIRQLLYITESTFAPQSGVLLSDLFSLTPRTLLVSERGTDKLFAAKVSDATDITHLEDANGMLIADPTRTIEQLSLAELDSLGVQPVLKAEVLPSLKALDPVLDKCEGVAVVDHTIVLCADNDFNLLGVNLTTTPATFILNSPAKLPKIITTPLPKIVFPDDD